MPAVFAFGITPGQGPGLVFVTLPHIFEKLPLGGIIAILFFLALFIAAITSSISLLEVVIAAMIEQMKMSRKKAVVIATTVIFSLSILCSLSQGVLGNFKLFGFNLFDLFDYISANILMTLGALFVVLFVGWKLGKSNIKDELSNGGNIRIPKWLFNTLYAIIRYLAPIVIIIIFLAGILS
ncbi:MAG: sodium-dependent transporter [Bacteroidales bacterium]|nr:sodium-dependent transporter [Bacteroidales bacterium]